MTAGWFDAFRENGAPTWYGENRTPVVTDTHTVTITVVFTLFYLAFLLIFPGVRRERLSSFIAVTLSLLTGAVILVCIEHPCWKEGSVHIIAPYRAFSPEHLTAKLGLKIGLQDVNITLKGAPAEREHSHFFYNERFKFTEVRTMQEELRNGLIRGLPYPILSVVQYLSVDRAGFVWGRQFRLAGYYTSCLLWFCFALWILSVLMLCLVPLYYSKSLVSLGACMCLSVIVYALTAPNTLTIPFSGLDQATQILQPSYAWCFWLTLSIGLICLVLGLVSYICEKRNLYEFATFLQVDFDELYRESSLITNTKRRRPPNDSLEPPSGRAGDPVVTVTGPTPKKGTGLTSRVFGADHSKSSISSFHSTTTSFNLNNDESMTHSEGDAFELSGSKNSSHGKAPIPTSVVRTVVTPASPPQDTDEDLTEEALSTSRDSNIRSRYAQVTDATGGTTRPRMLSADDLV